MYTRDWSLSRIKHQGLVPVSLIKAPSHHDWALILCNIFKKRSCILCILKLVLHKIMHFLCNRLAKLKNVPTQCVRH